VTVKIKTIRAKLGRFIRKTGKALSLPTYGPISVRHGKPEGAKTVDEERTKVAPPSRPVLPKIHPLLATNLISFRSTWAQRFKGLKVFGPTVSVVEESGELLADLSVEW
jgi:hypothetical protein